MVNKVEGQATFEQKAKFTEILNRAGIEDPTDEQISFLEKTMPMPELPPDNVRELLENYIAWYSRENGLMFYPAKDDLYHSGAVKVEGNQIVEVHGFQALLNPSEYMVYKKKNEFYGENMVLRRFCGTVASLKARMRETQTPIAEGVFEKYLPYVSKMGEQPQDILHGKNRHLLVTNDFFDNGANFSLIHRSNDRIDIPFSYHELQKITGETEEKVEHLETSEEPVEQDAPIEFVKVLIPETIVDTQRVEDFIAEHNIDLSVVTPEFIKGAGLKSVSGLVFEEVVSKELETAEFTERISQIFKDEGVTLDFKSNISRQLDRAVKFFADNTASSKPDRLIYGRNEAGPIVLGSIEIKSGRTRAIRNRQLKNFLEIVSDFVGMTQEKMEKSGNKGICVNGEVVTEKISFTDKPKVIVIRPHVSMSDADAPQRQVNDKKVPVYMLESTFTAEEIESYVYKRMQSNQN